MQVACCQFDIAWEDKPANYARVERLRARGEARTRARCCCLPEMFATGFSMNAAAIAEPPDGPTAQLRVGPGAKSHGLHVLAGIVLERPKRAAAERGAALRPGRRNCAAATRRSTASASPAKTSTTRPATTPVKCAGRRLHECSRRSATTCVSRSCFATPACAGAELICVIANWPAARNAHWMALLKARAIENQAYVAGVQPLRPRPERRIFGPQPDRQHRGARCSPTPGTVKR